MHFRRGCGREAADDVGKVGFGIKPAAAGAGHDGVVDGAVFSSFAGTEKQEVLFANGAGPDLVFDQIMPPPDLCRVHKLEAHFPRVCHSDHFPHAA